MKFIRCVIDVRPLRLLADCMAVCPITYVSHFVGLNQCEKLYSRLQQQHPHPRALVDAGPCAVSEATGCFLPQKK